MKTLVMITGLLSLLLAGLVVHATPPPPANYRISSPTPELQNEEQIWVCPTDSTVVIAIWRDFRLGYRQLGIGRSVDGGNTWTDSLVKIKSYLRQTDPCLDVDAEGNFYANYMDYDGYNFTFTTIKSQDKGLSWTSLAFFPPTSVYVEDKQFITLDRTGGDHHGNLYIAWTRGNQSDVDNMMMFARLPKDSSNFDTPIVIDTVPDWTACGIEWGQAGFFAQPMVGSDGTVYMFWDGNHVDPETCTLYKTISMVKSTDGGVSFSPINRFEDISFARYNIDGDLSVYANPAGAADIFGGDFDGNIYIAYADMDTAKVDYEKWDFNIKFIRSTDNGETWSEPYYINDDSTGSEAVWDQFHPWLYCNQEGTLIAIFYDQRLDTLNHWKFDLFAAYSFDGGETFTTNHRITEVSSDPDSMKARDGYGSKAGKIGEYIGLTAYKDHINAAWTDGRNANQEVWGANWVTPLLEPRLLAPADQENIPDGLPTLEWATSWKNGDDRYRLEIATDNQFINMVETGITDTNFVSIIDKPMEEDLYYWRVKALKISTGDSSEYSKVRSFTTGAYLCVDSDGDGFGDPGHPENICPEDNCPETFSFDQTDTDQDGVGDICDNCPTIYNPDQTDDDQNGIGDACEFICGDPNEDGAVNILDISFIIAYLYAGGPAPDPFKSADVNNDDAVNILDISYLIAYLYMAGPDPDCGF